MSLQYSTHKVIFFIQASLVVPRKRLIKMEIPHGQRRTATAYLQHTSKLTAAVQSRIMLQALVSTVAIVMGTCHDL
jgi:hypothetical protein